MNATVNAAGGRKTAAPFLSSTLGMKVVMAVTGVVLFGFVVGHVTGNLLIFLGPERLNEYSKFLHESPLLLWGSRIVLLAAVLVHIVTAVRLHQLGEQARPIPYSMIVPKRSTYATRTMYWSGPIIALFVVYHLLHYTVGTVHPDFRAHDVYHNVVTGFRSTLVAGAYVAAMLALGLHLSHGLWSLAQTLGVNHPRMEPHVKRAARAVTALIAAGFISIPVAVQFGWLR